MVLNNFSKKLKIIVDIYNVCAIITVSGYFVFAHAFMCQLDVTEGFGQFPVI